MKKFFAVLFAVCALCLALVGFAGCSGSQYTIAVLQYAEHGSLDNCYEGIRAGLAGRGCGGDGGSYEF